MPGPLTYRGWTAEEDDALRAWYGKGDSARQIGERLDRSQKSVYGRVEELQITRFKRQPAVTLTREITQRHDATVLAPIATSPEPDDAFLERVRERTSRALDHAKQERYATLRIVSDKPVGVSLSSDWHLTATGPTDVEGLLDYADGIAGTDRLYALAVGDMTDNPIKHKPTAVGDIPDDLRLLDLVIARFKGKLLGMTSGNHDDWTRAMVGIDSLQGMAERHQLHYAPDELIWNVEIVHPNSGDVTATWVIATRHKFRRHSNLNYTHACWRWLEENMHNWSEKPDVVAVGHNHVAAVEHRPYERGTVIACRMGAWQYTSPYTRAGGWALQPPMAPVVILPPTRDVPPHAFEHWQAGIEALLHA